jgi:hypothetical protein
MSGLVGREAELAVVEELLGTAETGPAGLAVVGEPGIGKTMLWHEAVRRARERGTLVLLTGRRSRRRSSRSRGSPTCSEDVGPDVLERLPPPQRAALEAALLRTEAGCAAHGPLIERSVARTELPQPPFVSLRQCWESSPLWLQARQPTSALSRTTR